MTSSKISGDAGLAGHPAQLVQELARLEAGRRLCTGSTSTAASSRRAPEHSSDSAIAVVEHQGVLDDRRCRAPADGGRCRPRVRPRTRIASAMPW